MNYQFPIIETIEDVLPAVEDRNEFIVADRDDYKVINYNVGYSDTFDIDTNDTMMNAGVQIPKGVMRRECRGLIFDQDGMLISRPFHKFFNVGERLETHSSNINLTETHEVLEKLDGSMIRPILVGGRTRLATKMGVTDVAMQAEEYVTENQLAYMEQMMIRGFTPIFEFTSPDNRIVVQYETSELILIAVRNNCYGDYMPLTGEFINDYNIKTVVSYGSVGRDMEEYVARQRGKEGREGDIIRFGSGHMVKIKNDWYVRIHKVKDKIRSDRHILALVIENDLDDLYPHLDETDYKYVKEFEQKFHQAFDKKVVSIQEGAELLWREAEQNKKNLATKVLPASGFDRADWPFIFKYADGSTDFNGMVMDKVKSSIGNTAKYNELEVWLGL